MNNLVFSLNATMPLFIMMMVGYFLKKIGFIADKTADQMNKMVYRIFLPALLFEDLAKEDFRAIWDGEMILFCAVATVISIVIAIVIAMLVSKDKSDRGEIVQGAFRSAAATLGIAFMLNIYDSSTAVALMIVGAVPIYNVCAVLILSMTSNEESTATIKKTLYNVITNPIILSIIAGILWSLLKLPLPVIADKAITYLGNVASPLTLIVLGAAFEFKAMNDKLKEIIAVSFTKLILLCAIFLPIAISLGFREEKLVAILIMLGSGTTSSSFIMAKNMGHEGTISASAVMVTTFLSSFTIAFWLFVLKSFGMM